MSDTQAEVPPSLPDSGTQRRTLAKATHGVRITSCEGGIDRAIDMQRRADNGFSIHLETNWGDGGPPTITNVGLSWQAMQMLMDAYMELVNNPDHWKFKTGTADKIEVQDK